MSDRPRVIYWNNIAAPYVVDRFNALASRGVLDFEAWFTELRVAERSWDVDPGSWAFPHRMARVVRVKGAAIGLPPRIDWRRRPDLVVSLYAEQPYLAGLVLARVGGWRTAVWVEAILDSMAQRSDLRERARRFVFSRVDGILTVGDGGRRYAERYGARADRIHYVPHVVDVAHFRSAVTAAERERVRSLKALDGVVLVYVGQLRREKGVGDLVAAFAVARGRTDRRLSLLLVGDGPGEPALKQQCRSLGLRDVVFAGFQQKDALPQYYAAADVFVFPTLGDTYGLVLDEAMACSLPVLTSSAVAELGERVRPGVNGYVFPPGDVPALADRIVQLAEDDGLRAAMAAASARAVAWQSPAWWAERFERAAFRILVSRA